MDDNKLSLENEIENFGRYFENNIRCILSAPFGEGKSFFLNEFEKSKEAEYDFITLYPTNYQVCDNRDIFENIKRDILLALLTLDDNLLKRYNRSRLEIIYKAIIGNSQEIIKCIPDIGVGLFNISPSQILNTIKGIYNKHKTETSTEGNTLTEFLNEIEAEKSPIYEFDPISRLICEIISQRQEKKKTVLVIEDLDRIDPGNIFRILNVFSAHFSQWNGYDDGSTNKFGFDKILIVCDYRNIETIYHHLYGEKTDFIGYISKFSPNKIFSYSLRSRMTAYLSARINSYLKNKPISDILAEEIIKKSQITDKYYLHNFRNLINRLEHSADLVDTRKLYFTIQGSDMGEGKLHISKHIPMLMFLAICKQFSIPYEVFFPESEKEKTSDIRATSALFDLVELFYLIDHNRRIYFDNGQYYITTQNSINIHFNHNTTKLLLDNGEIIGVKYHSNLSKFYLYEKNDILDIFNIYQKYITDIPLI